MTPIEPDPSSRPHNVHSQDATCDVVRPRLALPAALGVGSLARMFVFINRCDVCRWRPDRFMPDGEYDQFDEELRTFQVMSNIRLLSVDPHTRTASR